MSIAQSKIVASLLAGGALVVGSVALHSQHASASDPAEPLALSVVADGAGGAMRLVLREGTREAGSIAVPPGVTRAALDAASAEALWHPDGRDVALGCRASACAPAR